MAEEHLYTVIKVARHEDLLEQIGSDIYFDLVDHEKVCSFRIHNWVPFNLFKEEVAKEFGIPVQFHRFWLWEKRQNLTYRPLQPLTPLQEAQSVGQLGKVSNKEKNTELKLFLEVELGLDLWPIVPLEKTKNDVLLFFKLYDPLKEELRYVGKLFVKRSGKPVEILTKLNEMAGFGCDEEIDLFEEIKFELHVMCEQIDKMVTFHASQLQDGDIICFQKSQVGSSEQCRYPDVPSFLNYIRLKKELEEMERKRNERAVAHCCTIIKVARNENLLEQIGRNIYFDLVDHEKVHSFCIPKQMSFHLFKVMVAAEFDVPVQFQQFWLWAKRQNHTYRPNRSLTPLEEAQSVGQLREVSYKENNAELKLFLDVELGPDLRPIAPLKRIEQEILVFFKLYDPLKEDLRYVGRLFVKGNGKPVELLFKLNEMAGFSCDEEIDLFEEIKFEPNVMCEQIDKMVTFYASQIQDGDIICFQKSQVGSSEQFRYPDVPSFLNYVRNRQVVRFRSLKKPTEDECCLELSKLHKYDDVVERVARHLGLDDPSKIRLTSHNCYTQQPKRSHVKYRGVEQLSDMLVHCNQSSDILYYEILDIPLPELQGLRTLKVDFHDAIKDEIVIHTITFPRQSTIGDVINDLKTKVELSHPNAEIRLLELFGHKIYKIFLLTEKIENINEQYWKLRAEEIPEEEKNFGPHDRLICVYHFMKDIARNQHLQNFGEPFLFVICEDETLAEVKVRVQKKLQVPDEEFATWKFAFLPHGRPEYLQDNNIVARIFQRMDVYSAWAQHLGLEHNHNASNRSHTANQVVRFQSLEKPTENEFSLELSKYRTYDDVVERVAQHLRLDDPLKIRLSSHNCCFHKPKRPPMKCCGVEHFFDRLVHYNQTSDILYYEILDDNDVGLKSTDDEATNDDPIRSDVWSNGDEFVPSSSAISKESVDDIVTMELRSVRAKVDAIAAAFDRANTPNNFEEQLFGEIMKIGGMSDMSRMRAYQALTENVNAARGFLGCPEERRHLWMEVKFGSYYFDA